MDKIYFATHIASILTLCAYLLKDILWLRVLTIFACIAGIIFNYSVAAQPLWAVIYWNLIFIAINVMQIIIILKERSGVRFTDEEKELYETLFKNFAPFEFMKLLRLGKWVDAKDGQVLVEEEKTLEQVVLIYNGLLSVEVDGKEIAQLRDGSWVGEISLIKEGVATATVRAIKPTRYLSWAKVDLRHLLKRNPNMKYALETVLNADLVKKLAPPSHNESWV